MNINNILVSGTNSGLGRYLFESFVNLGVNTLAWNREVLSRPAEAMDAIIHCAGPTKHEVLNSNLYEYYESHVELTRKLLSLPHKLFVYISSIDVYPTQPLRTLTGTTEDSTFRVDFPSSMYGIFKLLAEKFVEKHSSTFLILRCSALLGPYARPNSLIKIATHRSCKLSLSGSSELNYVDCQSVLHFIQAALERDNVRGVYNLVSHQNYSLEAAAKDLNREVEFGNFTYLTGSINNSKAAAILPEFSKTSQEVALNFLKRSLDSIREV